MKNGSFVPGLIGLITIGCGGAAVASGIPDLSIYEIQNNTTDGDISIYNGEIRNVTGGVVTHIWQGFNDRVYLQDPAHPTFGAIVVKDGEGGDLAGNVNIGDWISFENIYIDEYRGTTFLQYRTSSAPDVSFTKVSSGNALPQPPVLTAADLVYPPNHLVTESYESMIVTLQGVTVGLMDLGKAGDNYELIQGSDIAWAADYMNVDAGAPYDPRVVTGAEFSSLTGIVEQYTKLTDGWDYYQVVTRSAADIVPEPATLSLLAVGMAVVARRRRQR